MFCYLSNPHATHDALSRDRQQTKIQRQEPNDQCLDEACNMLETLMNPVAQPEFSPNSIVRRAHARPPASVPASSTSGRCQETEQVSPFVSDFLSLRAPGYHPRLPHLHRSLTSSRDPRIFGSAFSELLDNQHSDSLTHGSFSVAFGPCRVTPCTTNQADQTRPSGPRKPYFPSFERYPWVVSQRACAISCSSIQLKFPSSRWPRLHTSLQPLKPPGSPSEVLAFAPRHPSRI